MVGDGKFRDFKRNISLTSAHSRPILFLRSRASTVWLPIHTSIFGPQAGKDMINTQFDKIFLMI